MTATWHKVWAIRTDALAEDGQVVVERKDGDLSVVKVGEPIATETTKSGKTLYVYLPLRAE